MHDAALNILSFLPIRTVWPSLRPFSQSKILYRISHPGQTINMESTGKWSMTFTTTNFHETPNSSIKICGNLLCQTASDGKCKKLGEKLILRPYIKFRLHRPQLKGIITRRYFVLNFTKISHEIRKSLVQTHLRTYARFQETHACLQCCHKYL
jgi:hypothetical protein